MCEHHPLIKKPQPSNHKKAPLSAGLHLRGQLVIRFAVKFPVALAFVVVGVPRVVVDVVMWDLDADVSRYRSGINRS